MLCFCGYIVFAYAIITILFVETEKKTKNHTKIAQQHSSWNAKGIYSGGTA